MSRPDPAGGRTETDGDGQNPGQRMRAAGMTVLPVRRIAAGDVGALRRAVADRSGPVLCTGLTDRWGALATWNPAGLRRRHSERQVTALVGLPDTGVLFPQDQHLYEKTLGFSEFVDIMLTTAPSAPCYLAYRRAHEIFDPADYDFASLVPSSGRHPTDTRVWIGSAGTRSMLHSDLKDNLFCQVWGEKDVTLLDWRDSRAAYPFPDNLVNSQVDLGAPDLKRFPRLGRARFHHVRMGPGDLLYVPRGCWHDIRARTPSISINHWFGEPLGLARYLRLLAVLGPDYWRSTARDFVVHGLLHRKESTRFFFSPASTGKRLYDALRSGNFSQDNDPSSTQ
ncbi:cupin-like domain-containing protein [Streptomyces sp. BE230]|uniref:cupin-like domain-containing protein n=1 Tax=Streptomyces sp. BE230 TaxID=3002526 RepID=UPI002ED45E37|nr:cupin-like domain-containing protein [Streptomyces sp. BE230]